jgi:hypothetical protein
MSLIRKRLSVALIAALCAGWYGTAAAIDPLVLFLLRMMRDSAISSALEAGVDSLSEAAPKNPAADIPRLAPLPAQEGQWLKALIDESFVHLSAAQREELFASLTRMLNDPRNAQLRSAILAEFTGKAIAMRDAQRRLAGLTTEQMQAVAAEARQEFERLPLAQREQMLRVLQHGIPGMPRQLNEIILAEFHSAAEVTR